MMIKTENKKVEINEENPYVLIATYGTLRLNQNNYNNILKGNSEHLGTYKSEKKFQMFGKHAGFPIVTTNGNTAIEYDLFRVTDPLTLRRLHRLEGCTGEIDNPQNWYNLLEINTEHGPAYMYVQHEQFNEEDIIESGNWLDK